MSNWIPVSERLPDYLSGLKESRKILILDKGTPVVGTYHNGKFEYWTGSLCNLDIGGSQWTITHWMPIVLLKEGGK